MGDKSDFTNFSMGWGLPLAQAFVSGLIAFFLVLAGAILLKADRASAWALGAGALVAAMSWFSHISLWRGLVYRWEEIHQDIIDDRAITEPIHLELHSHDEKTIQFIDFPCQPDQLVALAKGLLSGATLSEASWTGSGNLFTRAQFVQLRNELVKRNLAAWNSPHSPARGATLTRPGVAAMRYFASLAEDTPTLTENDYRQN